MKELQRPKCTSAYAKVQITQLTNYLFKVNNRNIRKRCEICSKLTMKTPELRQGFSVILNNWKRDFPGNNNDDNGNKNI